MIMYQISHVLVVKRDWAEHRLKQFLYIKNGIYYWAKAPEYGEMKDNLVYGNTDVLNSMQQIADYTHGIVVKHIVRITHKGG